MIEFNESSLILSYRNLIFSPSNLAGRNSSRDKNYILLFTVRMRPCKMDFEAGIGAS